MSIATIVTRGYGSFGSIAEVTTRGYIAGAAVTPPVAEQPGAGGGGGSSPHWWPDQGIGPGRIDHEKRESIAKQLMDLYDPLHAAAQTDGDLADDLAALTAEYAPTNAADPPSPEEVDWEAFVDDGRAKVLAATIKMKELVARNRQDALDDEDAIILLLLT